MQNDDLVCVLESKHGTAISEQLNNILEGAPLDEQNPNALNIIAKFLRQYSYKYNNEEWLDRADEIKEYLAKLENE